MQKIVIKNLANYLNKEIEKPGETLQNWCNLR
jgi:hypothetical protein